jgi:hypothetical protein
MMRIMGEVADMEIMLADLDNLVDQLQFIVENFADKYSEEAISIVRENLTKHMPRG